MINALAFKKKKKCATKLLWHCTEIQRLEKFVAQLKHFHRRDILTNHFIGNIDGILAREWSSESSDLQANEIEIEY